MTDHEIQNVKARIKDTMAQLLALLEQDKPEKTYSVGMTIYNTLEIEARTKEEAEEVVRNMIDGYIESYQDLCPLSLLEDADFNISRIDEELTK